MPSVSYISEDTYKGQVDNPLSLNRYTYVHNNPLRFIDPTGHVAAEGAGSFFGGSYQELMLYWSDKAAAYADAHNIADYRDAVDIVVPAEHREEVKTIVFQNGATRSQRTAGDVSDLGLAAPAAGMAAAGAIKNTGKSSPMLNKPAKVADHHIFPKFRGNDKYTKFFKERGINVDDFTVTLSRGKNSHHQKFIHGQGKWNEVWKSWIDANPKATAKEIFQQAGKMMDDFGLSGTEFILTKNRGLR